MASSTVPRRILIVRLSHLGDVVSTLGLFHALHDAYPRAEIGWAVQPEFAELVGGLPALARTFFFGRRDGWRAWPRLREELAAFGADLAVDAQCNLKSAAVLLASGAGRRAAPARADWSEPWGAWAANDRAPALPAGRRHALARTLALARHVAPAAAHPPRRDPALSEAERATGRSALAHRLPEAEGAPVLLHLSSPEDVRGWPREHWVRLARELAPTRAVLVLCGPDQEALGRAVAAELAGVPRVAHWIAQRGIRLLAALFAAAAERGARLVACDSGPMHLAAAVGLPVLVLEGPQDAARTGPWPPPGAESPHRVVRAADEPRCAPCFARRCTHAEGPVCMTGLDPARVAAACLRAR